MTINELIERDSTFTESAFKAKVDNIYIMLLSSIISGDMNRVRHKLSDELYNKYDLIVSDLNNQGVTQLYDELNVKDTIIDSIEENNEEYLIHVTLISRYMPYRINKQTGTYICGIKDHRIEINNKLVFSKRKDAKEEGASRTCTYCGAPIDANNNGICRYCNMPYNTKEFDWILKSMN